MSDTPATPAPVTPTSAPTTKAPAVAATPSPPAATASPAAGTETPSEKRRRLLTLKVDGIEEQVDLDAMPDEEITTRLQLEKASRKRMQEAADVKKTFAQLLEAGQTDPIGAFESLFPGKKFREVAESFLRKQYEEESLPEPERKHLEMQRRLEERERKIKEFEATQEAQKRQVLDAHVGKQMEATFIDALKSADLPPSRETYHLMAQLYKINMEHGLELTPQQLGTEVRKQLSGLTQGVFRKLKGAALRSYLGEETYQAILRMGVDEVRAKKNKPTPFESPTAPTSADDADDVSPAKRRMTSMQEWRKYSRL